MEDTKKYLKQVTKNGKNKIYVIQRSVSRSGMLRKLTLMVMVKSNMINITHDVAQVLGWKTDNNGDLKVTGCGMDMHFHTVYTLSCDLFGFSADKGRGGYKLQYQSL